MPKRGSIRRPARSTSAAASGAKGATGSSTVRVHDAGRSRGEDRRGAGETARRRIAQLAEQQRTCPILKDSRLGSMGPPVKLTLDGETVFLCCSGCKGAGDG